MPTSSVNMATQAGMRMSSSASPTRRTRGSAGTAGGRRVDSSGWLSRISRAGPQCGSSRSHRAATADAGPTIDEQRRPCRRARSANAASAAGASPTGTRLAPAKQAASSRLPP